MSFFSDEYATRAVSSLDNSWFNSRKHFTPVVLKTALLPSHSSPIQLLYKSIYVDIMQSWRHIWIGHFQAILSHSFVFRSIPIFHFFLCFQYIFFTNIVKFSTFSLFIPHTSFPQKIQHSSSFASEIQIIKIYSSSTFPLLCTLY